MARIVDMFTGFGCFWLWSMIVFVCVFCVVCSSFCRFFFLNVLLGQMHEALTFGSFFCFEQCGSEL